MFGSKAKRREKDFEAKDKIRIFTLNKVVLQRMAIQPALHVLLIRKKVFRPHHIKQLVLFQFLFFQLKQAVVFLLASIIMKFKYSAYFTQFKALRISGAAGGRTAEKLRRPL